MQATTVLLIFVLVGPTPMRTKKGARSKTGRCIAGTAESPDIVLIAMKEALHWLHYFGRTEEAPCQAFELCNSFIHCIALCKGLHLGGIPFTTMLPQMTPTAHH